VAIKSYFTEDDAKCFAQMRPGDDDDEVQRYGSAGAIRQVRYLPDSSATLLFGVAHIQHKLLKAEEICSDLLSTNFLELDDRMFELENVRSMMCECAQGGRGSEAMPTLFGVVEACLNEIVENTMKIHRGEPPSTGGPLWAIYRKDQESLAKWGDPGGIEKWADASNTKLLP
jgi:hypothetical protein